MNKRASTFLFLALTGAMMFNYAPSSSKQAAAPLAAPQTQASKQSLEYAVNAIPCPVDGDLKCAANCTILCPSQDLRGTISDFFGPEGNSTSGKAGDPLGVPADIDREQLQFMIATVPDPVHTHLSLHFDQSAEAIEQAIDSAGYIFARATAPWDNQQHPESSDFLLRLGQQVYQQAKEQFPGVLIFRRRGEHRIDQSLFVFLVGEIPTEGINKQQFHNALRAIHMIGWGTKPPAPSFHLRILGPTFSGSLYSLREIFTSDAEARAFSHVVVFGTVTNKATIQWFVAHTSSNHIQFPQRRQDDASAMQQFKQFVSRLGYGPDKIAELSEDETAYGGDPSQWISAASGSDSSPPENDCRGEKSDILRLQFPRDIASLRAAYEQELRQERLAEQPGKRPPHAALPLNLEDTGSDDDGIATYSHAQTPLSEDEVLLGIVSRLRASRIRFIVLRSTNALDRLFLSRYLRTAYPQGRIVIDEADRLFQNRGEGAPVRGVLALTSRPLWTGQAWHDWIPRKPRPAMTFPSLNAAETYYAMRDALLFPQDFCALGTLPRCATSGTNDQKAVWVTAIGRDGSWPLAHFDDYDDAQAVSGLAGRRTAHLNSKPEDTGVGHFEAKPTISWMLLYFTAILLAATYILLTWKGSVLSSSGGVVAFAPVRDATRSRLLCLLGWFLLATLLAIFAPALLPWSKSGVIGWLWTAGAALTMLALIGSGAFDLKRRGAPSVPLTRISFWFWFTALVARTWFWFAAGSFGLLVGFYLYARFGGNLTGPDNIFLYRYIHLSSGVSPLVPWLLLLGAALWWAWYHLKGLIVFDGRRPRLPEAYDLPANLDPAYKRLSDEGNRRLVRLARPLTGEARVYIAPLVGAGFMALLLRGADNLHAIQGLERKNFDLSYEIALALVLIGMASTLLQLALTWVDCRSLLRSLDRLPLRRGFKALKEFSWRPIWQLSVGGPNQLNAILAREVESILHLHNKPILRSQSPELAESIATTQECLKDLRAYFARSPEERRQRDKALEEAGTISRFERLRIRLASTCGKAMTFLKENWDKERGLVLLEEPNEDENRWKSNGSDAVPAEIQATEQFVCLVYVNFIFMILRQIRNLLTIVAGMFVFAVLSLSSYPFEPKATLRSFMLVLFLVLAAFAATVYAQMHRDATLSRITDTTPGKLGGDFWLRLGTAVGLPLIGLVAYQFPQINDLFFSWLQPALQALK